MFTRQALRRVTATLGGLMVLSGIAALGATPGLAQDDPRIQQRRLLQPPPQQQQAQPGAPQQRQLDPGAIQQRRLQQPPAPPPVYHRPQFQPPQADYRPPAYRPRPPNIYYGAPRYEPPPVVYRPPPRSFGPQSYEIDEEPVYRPRYPVDRACRIVNVRRQGRVVALRECRVCGPVVTRDRYGQRIRVNQCRWVRR